jgi:hypothetical protein
MKFDYNKKNFTREEQKILLRESEVLTEKHPDRIPILIQIDSNILKMEKNKFLVADDVTVNYYFDVLKRKLSEKDTLIISVVKFNQDGIRELKKVKSQTSLLKDFFEEHKDPSTGMLILNISRSTTYKWARGLVSNFLGI